MTNFFKWLFGRRTQPQPSAENPAANPATPAPEAGFTYRYPAELSAFLGRNFYRQAFDAALQFPHAENRQYLLQTVVTEYRLLLQEIDQRLNAQLVQHQQQYQQTKGLSPILDQQLQNRIDQINGLKTTLEQQLTLSVDHEGWITPALAQLEHGFLNGIMQHQQQTQLLEGLNTLVVTHPTPAK